MIMNAKVEVRKSPIHGMGVFARQNIKKDEVILVWQPKLLTEQDILGLTEQEKSFYLYVENGKTYLQQEPERYVNHSCEPNSYVKNRCDVALRDIAAGEEITSNYLDQGDGKAPDKFVCNCKTPSCKYSRQ